MISLGKNIASNADRLVGILVEDFHKRIQNPDNEVKSLINQLRIIRDVNPKQYAAIKKQLPYVVCATFDPPYRKTDNFKSTKYFLLDIDHIGENGLDIGELRHRLEADPRVVLSFLSPGEDGLKLLFVLDEECTDHNLYSAFYKEFSRKFAIKHGLEETLDTRTSDVARACFCSYDPSVYFNPKAEPVIMDEYLAGASIGGYDDGLWDDDEKKSSPPPKKNDEDKKPAKSSDPDEEVLRKIKEQLFKKSSAPLVKDDIPSPEEIMAHMEGIRYRIADEGITIIAETGIQGGRQLTFGLGEKRAIINIFYGKKKQFSVVSVLKNGTNQLLRDTCALILKDYFRIPLEA